MAQLNFNIKGFDKLQSKISKLPKDLQEEVVGEIQAWGSDVNKEQQALISQQKIIDKGALRQKTKSFNDPAGVTLLSDVYYAPYVEFGTGAKVDVPAELNEYASQFKGGGKKEVNLPARPYFFPPYLRKRRELVKNIQEVIKKSL